MNNINKELPVCTVNGETDARKCPLFTHVYSAFSGNFTYSAINIEADGSIELDCFMPNISTFEVNDFLNKPLRIYKKILPNGVMAFSIRGAFSTDSIIDPTIYPDNRIKKIVETCNCYAYLVDTESNKILGIRIFSLNKEVYETISKALHDMEEKGCDTKDAAMGYTKYVCTISPSKFVKDATYLGRDKGSVRTQELILF